MPSVILSPDLPKPDIEGMDWDDISTLSRLVSYLVLTESLNDGTFALKGSLLCSTDTTILHSLQECCANSLQPTACPNGFELSPQ